MLICLSRPNESSEEVLLANVEVPLKFLLYSHLSYQ